MGKRKEEIDADNEQLRRELQQHIQNSGDKALQERVTKLLSNMSEFIKSDLGGKSKGFFSDYQSVMDILDDVVKRKLPTHETAADMKDTLEKFAENLAVIVAITGGSDETSEKLVSMIFRDMNAIKDGMVQYRKFAESLASFWPEISNQLKKPEYEGKTINTLYEEYLQYHRIRDPEIRENEPLPQLYKLLETARKVKEFESQIPKLFSPGQPNNLVITNTAVENALSALDGKGEVIGGEAQNIIVSHKKKNRPEVTVYVSASFDNMDAVKFEGKPWGLYDQSVHWAICSFVESRLEKNMPALVTLDMLCRFINGRDENEDIGEQTREEVKRSIEKMRSQIKVTVDYTNEMKALYPEQAAKWNIDEFSKGNYLIMAEDIRIRAGGRIVDGYLFDSPLLLKYAKDTNKIVRLPASMLQIREVTDKRDDPKGSKVSNSKSRTIIKVYLLRRFVQLRGNIKKHNKALAAERKREKRAAAKGEIFIPNPPKEPHSNVILMETLYSVVEDALKELKVIKPDKEQGQGTTAKETPEEAAKRKKKEQNRAKVNHSRYRKYVLQVLDDWKSKGDLRGYKIRHKGRTIDAIILELAPKF